MTSGQAEADVINVLVVDDNADMASLLSDALAEFGCVVTVAHDAPSALRAAAETLPEVAVLRLDIGLPQMDGYELAKRLRQDVRLSVSHCRLIAVTGDGLESHRGRAAAAGFDAHLVKPVSLQDLLRTFFA